MKLSRKNIALFSVYLIFLIVSWVLGFKPGQEIGINFVEFLLTMLRIVPFAFILIGLFEVWVNKETVERHLGVNSGFQGYLWAILLSGTTVGGLYVAFPVAYSMQKKGARLSVVFTYITSAAITRIPMAVFEATFLGAKFTAIRILMSLPLVVLSSILLEKYLVGRDFQMSNPMVDAVTPKTKKTG